MMPLLLSASVALSATAGRLAQDTPRELNDDIVRPGWLGFGVFLGLVVAAFFLFRSMNRQLKKVDFVEEPPDRPGDDVPTSADDEPPSA